jgi:hypothetical protein
LNEREGDRVSSGEPIISPEEIGAGCRKRDRVATYRAGRRYVRITRPLNEREPPYTVDTMCVELERLPIAGVACSNFTQGTVAALLGDEPIISAGAPPAPLMSVIKITLMGMGV